MITVFLFNLWCLCYCGAGGFKLPLLSIFSHHIFGYNSNPFLPYLYNLSIALFILDLGMVLIFASSALPSVSQLELLYPYQVHCSSGSMVFDFVRSCSAGFVSYIQ